MCIRDSVYAEGYRTTVSLSEEDFKNAAQSAWNCTLEGDPSAWIGDITNNTSGYVSAIVIGGEARKGTEARTAFGLRSANFEVKYENGTFTFYVKGYGHGVGTVSYTHLDVYKRQSVYFFSTFIMKNAF